MGGGAHRIPQYYSGMKSKDQILHKWDPVSQRLVTTGACPPKPCVKVYSSGIAGDGSCTIKLDAGDWGSSVPEEIVNGGTPSDRFVC